MRQQDSLIETWGLQRPRRRAPLLALGLLVFSHLSTTVLRADDSVWEVSTRGMPECIAGDPGEQLRVHRVVSGSWVPSSLDDLACDHALHNEANPPAICRTVVYVHGNWTTAPDARHKGMMFYHSLRQRTAFPIRFIIYSWPSERQEGFARDVLGKKSRLYAESYYLASLLGRLDPATPLSFLGFSFGGPVIFGALHLDAGGALAGRQLTSCPSDRLPARVSLTAAALDRNSLCPHGQYSLAPLRLDKIVNLYNSSDSVLKRFRFFDRQTAPEAAGFRGLVDFRWATPTSSGASEILPQLIQYDCSPSVGRKHSEITYFQKCPAFRKALENLLGR